MSVLLDLGEVSRQLGDTGLDACTLNNALNIAQLIALVAVVKWLREDRQP